jgi:CheY-like chemotaxis protein/anti-sigma regulatory factor (Ser/Thr protein kinase)
MQLEHVEFDMETCVDEALEMVASTAQTKGLELGATIDPEVPSRFWGDPARLRQALVNYLANAIKFTQKGAVRLSVELEPDTNPRKLRFAVTDTGVGLTLSQQQRLFNPFTQADASTSRHYGGTGLGLVICKRLAEAMGGEVGVESIPNTGTTFWLTAALEPVAREEESRTAKGRILLLNVDGLSNTGTIENILSRGGYAVDPVAAAEALDTLKTGRYHAVFIDAGRSVINSFNLGRQIRSNPAYSQLPLLLLVLPGDAFAHDRARMFGFQDCLAAPFRRAPLLNAAARALGLRETEAGCKPDMLPPPDLQGRRILVAEDNPTNQRVVVLLLEQLGAKVDIYGDAMDAARAALRDRYDLILMDLRMPEMDGFAATSVIRTGEANAGRRTPIVAVTAHALHGERERCLAAGMDDFLAKPIVTARFHQVLARLLPPLAAPEAGGELPAGTPALPPMPPSK